MRLITTCASLKGQSYEHMKQILDLRPVAHVSVTAESNVALARNRQLTAVLEAKGNWDVCLMLDDDIFASNAELITLVSLASTSGVAVAALYPTAHDDVRVGVATLPDRRSVLLTGLGAVAFPIEVLERATHDLKPVRVTAGQHVLPLAQSGTSPDGNWWWNEDFWVCYRLGGVRSLAEVRPIHRKSSDKRLSDEALEECRTKINYLLANGEGVL